MILPSKFHSFYDLAEAEPDGYRIEKQARGSKVLVMAPHGGGIEPGTSEITQALAGNELSWYSFEGTKLDGNDHLHITSTHFDEPVLSSMLVSADTVFAVHGCKSRRKIIFVGGLDTGWGDRFIDVFRQTGFESERGNFHISGTSPRNLCNRGKSRKGVQVELPEGLRKDLFDGLDREGRNHHTHLFNQLILVTRQELLRRNDEPY